MTEIRITPAVYAMPDENHENLPGEIELPGVDKDARREFLCPGIESGDKICGFVCRPLPY
jgi:hypothetical protein